MNMKTKSKKRRSFFSTIKLIMLAIIDELRSGMSEDDYQKKLAAIQKKNTQKEYKISLKKEKNKYSNKVHIETSKLIAIYLFAILNAIVVYAMVAMWVFVDFTYLGVLISDIAAQVLIYAIYCMKAYHAKKQSENMKYKRDRANGTLGDIINAASECKEYVPLTRGDVSGFEPTIDDDTVV